MKRNILVEIPKGSRNKYELDKHSGIIKFDRMLFSSVQYPTDYGFFLNTLGLDGDPLDALVILGEPTFPGCLIEVRPIGVLVMRDDKGQDEKVLCVPLSDPMWNHLRSLAKVPPHLLVEIEHFFEIYKQLEKKKVKIIGWKNRQHAEQVIIDAEKRYVSKSPKKKKS